MKNADQECFKWSVTRALNPVKKNSERISKDLRKRAECLNFQGIEFPMKIKDIDKFEKQNRGLSINVFGEEKEEVYPLRLSKIKSKPINLLLISNSETTHYCLIENMSRLYLHKLARKRKKKRFLFKMHEFIFFERILEKA